GVRRTGVPGAAQERDRYAGHARAPSLEGAKLLSNQRDRRLHQHIASEGGKGRRAAADLHPAGSGIQPAGGIMRPTIRWRLTLWTSLGLAVMLLVFAGLVYGLLRHALYRQIDRRLFDAFGQLEQDTPMATEPAARLRHWINEWREHENVSAVVYDAEGK